MESLLPQFETISLIHPTCFGATTSHLLEQRKFLSSQPLIFEFEGVPDEEDAHLIDDDDDDDDDDEDDSFDQELNFYNNKKFKSDFIYHYPINNNNNNNQISPIKPTPINNNNNNNNNSLEENNLNNSIENIKNQIEILHKEGHLKIPKVKSLNNHHHHHHSSSSNFQNKRKSFISISKTMKKNVFNCLINPIGSI